MTSRIKADLVLVDGALRSCPSRAQLKGGSAGTWHACSTGFVAVHPLCKSLLAGQSGSAAAASLHWRKSSASKKLLALLRAVIEEVHALQDEAAHDAEARAIHCAARFCAVHGSISVISLFWQRTQQSATLWPAMREWIVELGGISSLWTALAWVVMIPMQDFGAAADMVHQAMRGSIPPVLALTTDMIGIRRPVELVQNSAVITVMSSVLGDLLPRDFAAGNAQTWDLDIVLQVISALCYNLEGSMLSAHLHRPLLVFWPCLIAEMRRQHRLLTESAGASAPSATSEARLCRLKVCIHTGHLASLSPRTLPLGLTLYEASNPRKFH